MATGGFMSPPSGESFSGADNRPAVGAQGPPGSVQGLSPGEGAFPLPAGAQGVATLLCARLLATAARVSPVGGVR